MTAMIKQSIDSAGKALSSVKKAIFQRSMTVDDAIQLTASTKPKDLSLIDVSKFVASIQKQQLPLIRLETLGPMAVQNLILFSHLIFLACVLLAFFSLPNEEEILSLSQGFCGPADAPVDCAAQPLPFRYTSRTSVPSDTEAIQFLLAPTVAFQDKRTFDLRFNVRVQTTLEGDVSRFAAEELVSLPIECNEGKCKSPISDSVGFTLRYFVVQMEAQYNFLALAPLRTDVMVYFEFLDELGSSGESNTTFPTFESLGISLVTFASDDLVIPVIELLLSLITLVVAGCWLQHFRKSRPLRHLPQRDWITWALVGLVLYDNPVYGITSMLSVTLSQEWHFVFQTIQLVGYMLVMYWMLMMSTGIASTSPPRAFYVPKIALILVYTYVYFFLGFIFAFQPLESTFFEGLLQGVTIVSILGFQLAFYISIIYRSTKTWKSLHRLPYYRTRFQQLSFRVFLFQVVLLLISMLLQFSIALVKYSISGSLVNESTNSFNFVGRKVVLHTMVYVLAYCYLEPSSSSENGISQALYVVREIDIVARASASSRHGLVTEFGNQLYGLGNQVVGVLVATTRLATDHFVDRRHSSLSHQQHHHHRHDTGRVFCLETGARMLNSSIVSYYDPIEYNCPEIEPTTSSFGFCGQDVPSIQDQGYDQMHFISNRDTDTHAMCLEARDRFVISFRGTGSLVNIKTDLKARQVVYDHTDGRPECYDKWATKPRVHSGFWRAYLSIRKQLHEYLETQALVQGKALGKPKPIFFTGHSLGGALAVLAAIDVHDSLLGIQAEDPEEEDIFFDKPAELKYQRTLMCVYVFGAPRVGNHAFAEYFNTHLANTFRVNCDGDIVSGVPKHDWSRVLVGGHVFATYKHVGIEIVLDPKGNGNMFVNPSFVEKKFGLRFRGSARSHLLQSYRVGFKGLAEHQDTHDDHNTSEDEELERPRGNSLYRSSSSDNDENYYSFTNTMV